MTKTGKALTRETAVVERGRPIVVTLGPRYMTLHLKGLKESYILPYDAAFSCAAKMAVNNGGK